MSGINANHLQAIMNVSSIPIRAWTKTKELKALIKAT